MTDIFSVLDFYEVLKLLMGSGLYINIKLGGEGGYFGMG